MSFASVLPWLYLAVAILLEVTATSLMNQSEGFSKLLPALAALLIYAVCFFCMARALVTIPVGLAYAIWCGGGIVVIALIGLFIFKQHLSLLAWTGIGLILAGTLLAAAGGGVKG